MLAVITRLHYAKDDPKFIGRLETYKKYTLPSLLNQTDSDFDIYIWCEPHHDELFLSLHDRVKVMHATTEVRRKGRFFVDFTTYDKTNLPRYETQLGLDSDDEILPNTIEEVKKHLNGSRKAISIQPVKKDSKGNTYKMANYQRLKRISPIFAIHQPDEPYLFIYEYGHFSDMPKQFNEIVYLPELAIMNIHDSNESTYIEKGDIKIA